MNGNFLSLFLCLREELALMLERPRKGMSIVNCSSSTGQKSFPNGGVYAASKAAAINLSLTAAAEYGPHGIRVNALCPGGTLTAMTLGVEKLVPGWIEKASAKTPLGRFAEPLEIAQAVKFLLSEQASYITGAVLRADGGVAI